MPRREELLREGWGFALSSTPPTHYQPVTIPHDWAITAPFDKGMEQGEAQGFRYRWGIGWYRRSVSFAKKAKGHRYYLAFGGIYENSTVWVNGIEAGGRKYGYSPFQIEITDLIQTGENEILIKVDNTQVPVDRWYSGAGIYREVKLIEVEATHLDPLEIVVTSEVNKGQAIVRIDPGTQGTVRGILTKNGKRWEQSGKGVLEIMVENPELWSADTPALYTLTLQLMDGERIADEISQRIGFRTVEFLPNKGMFVNGTPVKLKGVCLHQDLGCRGVAFKKELWRERLLLLKEMGCNALRPSHHIFDEAFLDLCDELGFYVYEECFDKWTGGLYGRYFETEWEKDVAVMVKRDRNRPSIVIWGVGNEVEHQGQKSMLKILRMLKEHIVSLDDTRPVSYAMNPHFKRESDVDVSKVKDIQQFVDEVDDTEIYDKHERVQRIQGIAEIVDIISCNYQEQWYPLIHEAVPDKLILGAEVYQYFMGHPDQMQNFTEKSPILVPEEYDYVIGSMLWTGIDYLGESMGYPAKGWSGAVLRTNNERKPSYYLLQSYWDKKPMVHFSVMDYSLQDDGVKEHWDFPLYADHWHFPQFVRTVIPYMIATNCEEVSLYLNGKKFHLLKPEEFPNRLITGFLPWQEGTVEVVGYENGIEVCRQKTVTPTLATQLAFDTPRNSHLEEGEEILLTVRTFDEKKNPCFRESALIRFQAEGDAEIIAVDNGNLMENLAYEENFIHLHRGYASVVVRKTGTGRAVVRAFAEGFCSGETSLY